MVHENGIPGDDQSPGFPPGASPRSHASTDHEDPNPGSSFGRAEGSQAAESRSVISTPEWTAWMLMQGPAIEGTAAIGQPGVQERAAPLVDESSELASNVGRRRRRRGLPPAARTRRATRSTAAPHRRPPSGQAALLRSRDVPPPKHRGKGQVDEGLIYRYVDHLRRRNAMPGELALGEVVILAPGRWFEAIRPITPPMPSHEIYPTIASPGRRLRHAELGEEAEQDPGLSDTVAHPPGPRPCPMRPRRLTGMYYSWVISRQSPDQFPISARNSNRRAYVGPGSRRHVLAAQGVSNALTRHGPKTSLDVIGQFRPRLVGSLRPAVGRAAGRIRASFAKICPGGLPGPIFHRRPPASDCRTACWPVGD